MREFGAVVGTVVVRVVDVRMRAGDLFLLVGESVRIAVGVRGLGHGRITTGQELVEVVNPVTVVILAPIAGGKATEVLDFPTVGHAIPIGIDIREGSSSSHELGAVDNAVEFELLCGIGGEVLHA